MEEQEPRADPDIGGIYFMDSNATDYIDTYYNGVDGGPGIDKKIPDPTIRTAPLGD